VKTKFQKIMKPRVEVSKPFAIVACSASEMAAMEDSTGACYDIVLIETADVLRLL
jgi:hypothetical protein